MGDAAREIAILWAALYPLESRVTHNFNWSDCIFAYVGAVALMIFGIVLERRNRDERPSPESGGSRGLLDRVQ